MNQHLERLKTLAPVIQTPALELILRCEKQLKRTLLVVRTWSSYSEQLELYKKGRRVVGSEWVVVDPSQIVTKAFPGTSAHNVVTPAGMPAAMALDVVPLKEDGTPDWAAPLAFWNDLYEMAWKVGLDPLGDAIGAHLAYDKAHFEEPAWKLKLESWKEYRL